MSGGNDGGSLDEQLEATAAKKNLSVTNVKSILHVRIEYTTPVLHCHNGSIPIDIIIIISGHTRLTVAVWYFALVCTQSSVGIMEWEKRLSFQRKVK